MAFPVNPEFVNMRVDCPHCGANRILRSNEIIRDRPSSTARKADDNGFDWTSFSLAFVFNFPGWIVGAFLHGGRGALAGLFGVCANTIFIILAKLYFRMAQGF